MLSEKPVETANALDNGQGLNTNKQDRAADSVYRRLRLSILTGELKPHTRLIELDLAKRLNVSRTPVREAISRLMSDTLVQSVPGGGVEVVDAQNELDSVCVIREALEGMAARLAAQKISKEEVAELDRLVNESLALPSDAVALRAETNSLFHRKILLASRNPRLIRMVEDLRDFFLQEEQIRRYTPRDTKTALGHHAKIVDALRYRNGKKAEQIVRLHLRHSMKKTVTRKKGTAPFV